jgi:dolichol-phosphate mannosyltransferase
MCHLNVDMHLVRGAERLRQFVTFRYDFSHKAVCSAGHLGGIEIPHVPYRSSQLLTLGAGRMLTEALGLPGYLDLRAVAVVSCLLIGGAFGLLYWAMTWSWPVRLAVCAALLAVVADPIFIDFAASPFSEIAAIVGLLYVLPGVLLLVQGGRRRRTGLAVTIAGGTFLVTAKTQDAFVLVPLAVLLCAFRFPLARGPRPVHRLNLLLRDRLPSVTGVAVIASCVLTVGARQDRRDAMLTMGNFVTATVLAGSSTPAADLRALGGAAWLAELQGKPVWCATPKEMNTTDYRSFLNGLSHQRIALFLAERPDRIPRVLNTAAEYFYDPRPGYTLCSYADGPRAKMTSPKLANYGREDGAPPNHLDHRITPVSGPLTLLRGAGFPPLLLLWCLPAIAAFAGLRNRPGRSGHSEQPGTRGRRGSGEAVATLFLLSVAMTQFGICAFGDGIDTSKHLDLAVFATAAAWVTGAVACLAASRLGERLDLATTPEAALASDAGGALLEHA